MAKPRARSAVRTVLGLALLAAGTSALAACTSASARLPHGVSDAQPVAPPAPERGGSSSGQRTSGALGAIEAAAAGSGGDATLCGAAAGDVPPRAGEPRPTGSRTYGAGACGCDLRPCAGCEHVEKSYAVAARNILGYQVLLNLFDRTFVSGKEFGSDFESIQRNLSGKWVYDADPFKTNQFMHPYGGALYHGFARAAGLNFWESFGYDFAASAVWEIAGETVPPSINDQITTPMAGAFLGEALFRTASLMLERSCGRPSGGLELEAALVSPSTGVTRWTYGDRFDAVFPSHDPAVFWTWGAGVRRNVTLTDAGVLSNLNRDVAVATVSIDYGLPGKRGYSYDRPFDYFHLEATATSSENALPESVMVRGLLTGRDYSYGPKYCGIWGLYGTYDYFSPEIFKLSSSAVTFGTTGQYLATDKLALQGSIMGGVGFTASGTTANERAQRSYRYSVDPQGLLALRAVYGDRAMLDLTSNEYFLADSLSSNHAVGTENVLRAQISLTIRIIGRHAITIGFVQGNRDARFEDIVDNPQRVGGLSVLYTHLSDTNFGVVRH